MQSRAVWKGYLKLALISCPVKLHCATGEPAKVKFTMINRATLNKAEFLRQDSVTKQELEFAQLARGVEVGPDKYVEVTEDEIAGAAPPSASIIDIQRFVKPKDIGQIHVEDHYFLAPDGELALEAYTLIRVSIEKEGMVGLAPLSLGSHERLVALAPCGLGMTATVLRSAESVRDPDLAFGKLADVPPLPELLKLGRAIVASKIGAFDPAHKDRYQAALHELVQGKITGRMAKPATPPKPPKMVDLGDAVRRSVDKAARKAG
jgi:DNA end-binding protein Ku